MIQTPDLLVHRPFDFTTGLGERSEGIRDPLRFISPLKTVYQPFPKFVQKTQVVAVARTELNKMVP